MARIELKNSRIRLIDGYSNTAAVNDSAIASGDTTLGIDTVVSVDDGSGTANQIIPLMARFTVASVNETYTVSAQDAEAQLDVDLDAGTGNFTITVAGQTTANIAHDDDAATILAALVLLSTVDSGDLVVTKPTSTTVRVKSAGSASQYYNTAVVMSADVGSLTGGSPSATQTYAGGVTHDITFTPALATSATLPVDDAVITFTGRSLEIKVGDGNVEYTENREYIYDLDRDLLDTVREGEQVPMDVSIDLVWEFLTAVAGASTPTISDVLHRRGLAANWKSSATNQCEPFALDIEIEHETPCGADPDEVVTLPDFRWESLPHNLDDAQISMTGRCNATVALVGRESS